ncbi:UvrD-helicase domain-containing protein [Reinekea sp.]|jgi:superfamily I DNA/RNA helicase|uniref:UvrD-helicase domain-containing protein n=1 Tax=Reinekea sp. TaxID=1970455 RepID=UPI00398A2E52
MAMFIDNDFEKLIFDQGKLKRALEKLSDAYIVRLSLVEDKKVSDIVLEGPDYTWLLISVGERYPTEEDVKRFKRLNSTISEMDGYSALKLVVLTPSGPDMFSDNTRQHENVFEYKLSQFCDDIHTLVAENSVKYGRRRHQKIKKAIFSESFVWKKANTVHLALETNTDAVLEDVFLDYKQETISRLDLLTPEDETEATGFSTRLINGVAGSGKTLVLINRAVLYSRLHPTKKALVLVHNRPVMEAIKSRIQKAKIGEISGHVDVKTFHQYAMGIAARAFKGSGEAPFKAIFSITEIEKRINSVIAKLNVKLPNRIDTKQLAEEIDFINENFISNLDDYLLADRAGRGFSMPESERRVVWHIYGAACDALSSITNGYLPSLYIKKLCETQDYNDFIWPYDHVLIDEAQFFSPSWFSLVKKTLPSNGLLFLSADPNQGFLKARLSWKKSGINVVGRTRKLEKAYRTTFEIMSAAYSLIDTFGTKGEDYLVPDFENMRSGSKPVLIQPSHPQDELRQLVNEIEVILKKGVLKDQIMVVNAGTHNLNVVSNAIESRIGLSSVINLNDRNKAQLEADSKIKLLSLNSCTGMESGIVFVIGLGDLLSKVTSARLPEGEDSNVHETVSRMLFVAMTRACEKLVMFSTIGLPPGMATYIDRR